MKRLLLILTLTAASWAQVTTVTGVIKDLTNTTVTSGKAVFTLAPFTDTTISGLARFSGGQVTCPIASTGNVVSLANSNVTTTVGTTSPGTSVVVTSATGYAVGQSIFIPGAGTPGTNGGNYVGSIANIAGTTFTISPATVTSVNAGTLVYDPCQVNTNTAQNPPGSYYKVDLWPYSVKTSSFTFYAVLSWYDWSTVVPTPTTAPAQNFADVISNQTIGGNKTFSGADAFTGALTVDYFNDVVYPSPGESLATALVQLGGPGKIIYGDGTYPTGSPTISSPDVTIEGSGMPTYNSLTAPTALLGGTILQGPVFVTTGADRFAIRNIGIDVGPA